MHLRTWMKILILISIAAFIVVGAILLFYKPTYSVSYQGEFLGYIDNKNDLQSKINEYIKTGNGDKNIAFVQIEAMPKFEMCLLKRDAQTNTEEIYNKIINTGISYYKYYTILLNGEEKYNVATYEEAESVLAKLKEKDSNNIKKITTSEKYNNSLVEFASVDTCVEGLYEKKVVIVSKPLPSGSNGVNTSGKKVNLGFSLVTPVYGQITCRFKGSAHRGLDIATSHGKPIKVVADGTVTYAGYHYSYGNLLIVNHANGVQTYYAHCSALYVSAGSYVSQGQTIAAIGSTGNSTGPHLHLEIRVNGVAQNPQNYLY